METIQSKQQTITKSLQKYLVINCSEYSDGSSFPQFLSIMDNLTVEEIERLFKSTKQPFVIYSENNEEEKFLGLKKGLEANEGFLDESQLSLLQDLKLLEGEISLLLSKLKLAITDIQLVMEKVFGEIEQAYDVPKEKLNETKDKFTLKLTKATQERIKTMKISQLRDEFYDNSLSPDKVKDWAIKALGIQASA